MCSMFVWEFCKTQTHTHTYRMVRAGPYHAKKQQPPRRIQKSVMAYFPINEITMVDTKPIWSARQPVPINM